MRSQTTQHWMTLWAEERLQYPIESKRRAFEWQIKSIDHHEFHAMN
jgi:hypothetical protein